MKNALVMYCNSGPQPFDDAGKFLFAVVGDVNHDWNIPLISRKFLEHISLRRKVSPPGVGGCLVSDPGIRDFRI